MKELDNLTHQIVEFYEKLSSWEHSVVRGKGLTLPQMHTLEILGASGPLRMKELAHKMGVTTGTLTVQVDRLEGKGLVTREPNPDDRRSYFVTLTDKGAVHYKGHDRLHLRLTREITSEMTGDEIKALGAALAKMNTLF